LAKKKDSVEKDLSTEEKIKAAAKKLFTQKGFAATKTRDIAEEAGINLALLNYYFRSKEKLFELVMKENLSLFVGVLLEDIKSTPRSFEEQMNFIVGKYIDMLLANPDLPFFVLNLIQSGHFMIDGSQKNPVLEEITQLRAEFLKYAMEQMEAGNIKKIHPLHLMANMMSLIIFPFIASSLLMARAGITDRKEFEALMIERKKLIPQWMKEMVEVRE
jgi:AcrR family transcriptional regulator